VAKAVETANAARCAFCDWVIHKRSHLIISKR
jgi:hypothetical protein